MEARKNDGRMDDGRKEGWKEGRMDGRKEGLPQTSCGAHRDNH